MEKQQSAVEWFANKLYENIEIRGSGILYNDILNQAKELFKQQIEDAYNENENYMPTGKEAEQYFNETFKQ